MENREITNVKIQLEQMDRKLLEIYENSKQEIKNLQQMEKNSVRRIKEKNEMLNEFDEQDKIMLKTIQQTEKQIKEQEMQEKLKKSMEKSVINSKTQNKRKKKNSNLEKGVFLGAATVALSIGIFWGTNRTIDKVAESYRLRVESDAYFDEIYSPNTIQEIELGYNSKTHSYYPIHQHNWEEIIKEVYKKFDDPITAFYMIYTKLDEDCRNNKFNQVLRTFNHYYQTNYKSIEDVLVQNNFATFKDLRNYVKNELYNLEESRGF